MSILTIMGYAILDPNLGFDIVNLFGDGIVNTIASLIASFVVLLILFWASGYFFAIGWDAVSDTARWFRRRKINSEISIDLMNLKEILN